MSRRFRFRPRLWRLWLIPAGLLLLNLVAAQLLAPGPVQPPNVPYSTFKEQVQAGNVAEITTRGEAIQGTFRQPIVADGTSATSFQTRAPTFFDAGLVPLLEKNGVILNARPLDPGRAWWVG